MLVRFFVVDIHSIFQQISNMIILLILTQLSWFHDIFFKKNVN